MVMLPWMAMYALSAGVFNHGEAFGLRRASTAPWLILWEKDYAIEIPASTDGLRDTVRRLLTDNGLSGPFGVQRQGERLTINVPHFRDPLRLSYDIGGKKLRAEQRNHSGMEILIRLHERTGYGNGGVLNNLWAVIVDVFCVSTLVWIATGLYLWWKLSATRGWGGLAIGGGIATLLTLLATL
jgi:hypothetical protein